MDRPSPADAPARMDALTRRLRALPPSCGPVRLVAVDGHAGSGKTGFTDSLAAALGGAPVLHLDDLATHDGYFDWFARLRDQVLVPLEDGQTAAYEVYDWRARAFTGRRALPAAPVVLVEGVGAGRRALRPYLAHLLWMALGPEESWRRGRLRDGPEQDEFWDTWIPAERRHFAHDPSERYADLLVRESGHGHDITRGPASRS